MHGPWTCITITDDVATWSCGACGTTVGFPRPGKGEPSSDGIDVPAAIDDYVGPCPGPAHAVATGRWVLRFAPDEFAAIQASTDAIVKQLMFAVERTTEINTSDPVIVGGVQYLASVGLIAPDRVAKILE